LLLIFSAIQVNTYTCPMRGEILFTYRIWLSVVRECRPCVL